MKIVYRDVHSGQREHIHSSKHLVFADEYEQLIISECIHLKIKNNKISNHINRYANKPNTPI